MNTNTKTSRFIFAAALLCMLAARTAIAEQPQVTVKLTMDEIAEISRLIDRPPLLPKPPPAYWTLQLAIGKAMEENPAALAFIKARAVR